MKKIFYLTILLTIFFSCNNSENNDLTELNKQNELYENADLELENHKEKIVLLSIAKNIPTDSLYLILREYYSKTGNIEDEINFSYLKTIDTISIKLKIPKKRIANLIYAFKYEMITKENVEDELFEESESDYEPIYYN